MIPRNILSDDDDDLEEGEIRDDLENDVDELHDFQKQRTFQLNDERMYLGTSSTNCDEMNPFLRDNRILGKDDEQENVLDNEDEQVEQDDEAAEDGRKRFLISEEPEKEDCTLEYDQEEDDKEFFLDEEVEEDDKEFFLDEEVEEDENEIILTEEMEEDQEGNVLANGMEEDEEESGSEGDLEIKENEGFQDELVEYPSDLDEESYESSSGSGEFHDDEVVHRDEISTTSKWHSTDLDQEKVDQLTVSTMDPENIEPGATEESCSSKENFDKIQKMMMNIEEENRVDDSWIFQALGERIEPDISYEHLQGQAGPDVSNGKTESNVDLKSFSDAEKDSYVRNMYFLLVTARTQINDLKKENKRLSLKMEANSVVQCPECQHRFCMRKNFLPPKYIKVLKGHCAVEFQFSNKEAMEEWLIANSLDINRDGLPVMLESAKKPTLTTTSSLLSNKKILVLGKDVISDKVAQVEASSSMHNKPQLDSVKREWEMQSTSENSKHSDNRFMKEDEESERVVLGEKAQRGFGSDSFNRYNEVRRVQRVRRQSRGRMKEFRKDEPETPSSIHGYRRESPLPTCSVRNKRPISPRSRNFRTSRRDLEFNARRQPLRWSVRNRTEQEYIRGGNGRNYTEYRRILSSCGRSTYSPFSEARYQRSLEEHYRFKRSRYYRRSQEEYMHDADYGYMIEET